MQTFVPFAFLALFLFALDTVTQKLTTKYLIKNPLVFNFYFYPFALLFILPILLTKKVVVPFDFSNIALAAFFNVAAYLFYVFALYKIDVSIISPMYNLRIVFSTLLAIIVLGELLPIYKYAWLVVVIVAGFFVAIDERMTLKSFFQKPIFLLVFYFLGLSLCQLLLKRG